MRTRIISLALAWGLATAALTACGTAGVAPVASQADQATVQTIIDSAGAAAQAGASAAASTTATVLAANSAPSEAPAGAAESSDSVPITLDGATITADGAGVTMDGSTATITAAGSYRLSGTLDDGQIVVDTDDDAPVQLILSGATIRSSTSAPIYIKHASSAAIILADGTDNALADGESYVYDSPDEDEPNAALFSDDDLTITGGGTLTVEARYNDGISSKGGLTIAGGTISVAAKDDGIRGKDYLIVQDGSLTVQAGGDGLKADNADDPTMGYISIEGGTLDLTTGGDGIQAETDLVTTGGDVTIVAGGGSGTTIGDDLSAKGLKAAVGITLDGGHFAVDAADDGAHSDGDITVNGGVLHLATGDDALHAGANLTVNGGDIQITASYEGLEGANITLNDGSVAVIASDDGINGAGDTGDTAADPGAIPGGAATQGGRPGPGGPMGGGSFTLTVTGGTLLVDAAGDGIDVNGSITMSGGLVIVNGPTEPMNGALDYDRDFTMTGGTLVAVGSAGMAAAPGQTSSQNALLLNLASEQPAGTLIHIQSSGGDDLLTFAPSKAFQSLAFSSPALTSGETYDVYLGGGATGSAEGGLYGDASYTPGTLYTSFMVSSTLTEIGGGGRPW